MEYLKGAYIVDDKDQCPDPKAPECRTRQLLDMIGKARGREIFGIIGNHGCGYPECPASHIIDVSKRNGSSKEKGA